MNEFKNLDDMAKDAGEFIADSANKAKEAVVDAWPSEEIDKFGEDIKEKANQISEKADKEMKLAKEAVNETSDEFVESVMKSKDSAKDAWNEYVHDINIDDIKISEDIKNTVNKIDSYFRDNESGDIDAQDLGQYGDIDPYYYYHSRHDGQGIYINYEGLFEYNSVEETYASASYFSSCMMSLSQGDVDGFNESLKGQLHEIYSDSKFTNLLAAQFNLEESEISGVIDELVDKTIETAQTVNYLQFRVAVGAVQVAENVYKGVAVPYEKLKGNDEKANEIMSESFTDEIREAGEEAYNQNEVSQLVGDVAEEFGEEATECAVAVVALTTGTGSVAAVAATAGTTSILAFNNMGESLENSYELQGEVTDEAVLAAEITGAATVVATGVGSQFHEKITSSIPRIANKIAKFEKISDKVGVYLTGALVNSAYGANVASSIEMPDKIDKVVKVGLGIENNYDVKEEVKDYVTSVAGAAAIAGTTYVMSSAVKDTKAYESVLKRIKGNDFKVSSDKYENAFLEARNKLEINGGEITSKPIQNKQDGLAREKKVLSELSKYYKERDGYEILSERYLLDENGKRVLDPVTGSARRIDYIVTKDGLPVDSIEVTSMTADKTSQMAKESRILESGGRYIKNGNGDIVELNVNTRIERR